MQTAVPAKVDSKSIFTSRTFAGLAIIALPLVAQFFSYQIGSADAASTVNDLIQVAGLLVAAWGRIKASKTLTVVPPATRAPLFLLGASLALLSLAGCQTMSATTRAKWTATGQWLLGKSLGVALDTVVAAAQSPADAGAKADWLDSLAGGLRAQAVASFGSDDVRALAGIWTPDKPHWQTLAGQLAELVQQAAAVPPEERAEILARAVEMAAQIARARMAAELLAEPTLDAIGRTAGLHEQVLDAGGTAPFPLVVLQAEGAE